MNTFSQPVNIIIADTQILIIEGLKALLNEKYTISHVVATKEELLGALKPGIPTVLILDFSLLDFDGYDDLKAIRENNPSLSVIILTHNINRTDIAEYHNMGIRNILHKSLEKDELFECLDAVSKERKYYSGMVLDVLLESNDKKESANGLQLTASEVEIVRLIADGLTNKEIASKKFLSIHTIMTHRKNILRKLGVSNASELIMYAIRSGIIDNIEYHI